MASTLDISRTPNLRRGNTIKRLREDYIGYRGSQPLLLDLINSLFKLADGGIVQGIAFLKYASFGFRVGSPELTNNQTHHLVPCLD